MTTLPAPTVWFNYPQVPVDNTISGPIYLDGDGFVDQNGDDVFIMSIGLDEYVWCQGEMVVWNTITKQRELNTQSSYGFTPQQSLMTQLKNVKAGGFNCVRMLGFYQGNPFPVDSTGKIVQTTAAFDPPCIAAIGQVWAAIEQLGLKIIWNDNFGLNFVASDANTPEFLEMLANAAPHNGSPWWLCFDSIIDLYNARSKLFLTTINPSTGVPFGMSPSLAFIETDNEDDPCKNLTITSTMPLLYDAIYETGGIGQVYARANGIQYTSSNSLHKADWKRCLALQSRQQRQKRIDGIRPYVGPNVYIAAGTYYGDADWSSLVSLSCGDFISVHKYYQEKNITEPSNYTVLQANGISMLEAVLKGCKLVTSSGRQLPVILTEGNAISQCNDDVIASVPEQQAMIGCWVRDFINCRAAGGSVYSGGLSAFICPDDNPARRVREYDTLANANILGGLPGQLARLFKGRSRKYGNIETVVIPETYGTPGAAGPAYVIGGPYTLPSGSLSNNPGYLQVSLQDV
jgi:hypothetical protein